MLVLGITGFAWLKVTDIKSGTTTADVIGDNAGGPKPADGATDILLVGMDSRTDAQGNPLPKDLLAKLNAGRADGELNTDTLILLRVPNDGSKAVGISVPRDSYVDIPGYGKHKINSAYSRGKTDAMRTLRSEGVTDPAQLEVRSNQAGAKVLISTIQQLTGATIDHYAEVNLLGFYDITEAIGGVDVCLNDSVNDNFSGAHFRAGPQTISGVSALAFVRQRHGLPRGDLDRIVRQQVFMKALATKVLSAGMLTDQDKLTNLTNALKKSVVLDQKWDIFDFAKQMQGMTGGDLNFQTIPVGSLALKTDDGDAVEVKPKDVKTFVQSLLGGPTAPAPGGSGDNAANAGNAEITTDVRNATGQAGLANKVLAKLTDQGFKGGETGNAAARAKSVLRYAKGEKDKADKVAEALGGSIPVEQDANVPKGHVVVLLGKDYQDTAPERLTGDGPLQLNPAAPVQQLPAQQPPTQQPPATANGVVCVN